jgi:hypothetical protein
VVGALRSGLEVALRRRERAAARAAGACAKGGAKPAPGAPRSWADPEHACADGESIEAWEKAAAARLGWRSLDLAADATAPASMLDVPTPEEAAAAAASRKTTTRSPEALAAAAEALVNAVGAGNIRVN